MKSKLTSRILKLSLLCFIVITLSACKFEPKDTNKTNTNTNTNTNNDEQVTKSAKAVNLIVNPSEIIIDSSSVSKDIKIYAVDDNGKLVKDVIKLPSLTDPNTQENYGSIVKKDDTTYTYTPPIIKSTSSRRFEIKTNNNLSKFLTIYLKDTSKLKQAKLRIVPSSLTIAPGVNSRKVQIYVVDSSNARIEDAKISHDMPLHDSNGAYYGRLTKDTKGGVNDYIYTPPQAFSKSSKDDFQIEARIEDKTTKQALLKTAPLSIALDPNSQITYKLYIRPSKLRVRPGDKKEVLIYALDQHGSPHKLDDIAERNFIHTSVDYGKLVKKPTVTPDYGSIYEYQAPSSISSNLEQKNFSIEAKIQDMDKKIGPKVKTNIAIQISNTGNSLTKVIVSPASINVCAGDTKTIKVYGLNSDDIEMPNLQVRMPALIKNNISYGTVTVDAKDPTLFTYKAPIPFPDQDQKASFTLKSRLKDAFTYKDTSFEIQLKTGDKKCDTSNLTMLPNKLTQKIQEFKLYLQDKNGQRVSLPDGLRKDANNWIEFPVMQRQEGTGDNIKVINYGTIKPKVQGGTIVPFTYIYQAPSPLSDALKTDSNPLKINFKASGDIKTREIGFNIEVAKDEIQDDPDKYEIVALDSGNKIIPRDKEIELKFQVREKNSKNSKTAKQIKISLSDDSTLKSASGSNSADRSNTKELSFKFKSKKESSGLVKFKLEVIDVSDAMKNAKAALLAAANGVTRGSATNTFAAGKAAVKTALENANVNSHSKIIELRTKAVGGSDGVSAGADDTFAAGKTAAVAAAKALIDNFVELEKTISFTITGGVPHSLEINYLKSEIDNNLINEYYTLKVTDDKGNAAYFNPNEAGTSVSTGIIFDIKHMDTTGASAKFDLSDTADLDSDSELQVSTAYQSNFDRFGFADIASLRINIIVATVVERGSDADDFITGRAAVVAAIRNVAVGTNTVAIQARNAAAAAALSVRVGLTDTFAAGSAAAAAAAETSINAARVDFSNLSLANDKYVLAILPTSERNDGAYLGAWTLKSKAVDGGNSNTPTFTLKEKFKGIDKNANGVINGASEYEVENLAFAIGTEKRVVCGALANIKVEPVKSANKSAGINASYQLDDKGQAILRVQYSEDGLGKAVVLYVNYNSSSDRAGTAKLLTLGENLLEKEFALAKVDWSGRSGTNAPTVYGDPGFPASWLRGELRIGGNTRAISIKDAYLTHSELTGTNVSWGRQTTPSYAGCNVESSTVGPTFTVVDANPDTSIGSSGTGTLNISGIARVPQGIRF